MSARTAGLLLWLLVGGLAAAAAIWQLVHPPRPPAAVDGVRRPLELPVVAPVQPFQLPPPDQYDEIAAHPLFVVTRQPEPPFPEEAIPEKSLTGPEKTPMLIGVMISPGLTVALLRPAEPNAKVVRVKPGESVGDWRLEMILPNRVVLRKGQATQELTLERLKKPAKPKAPARFPVPVRPTGGSAPPANVPAAPQPEAPPPAIPAPPQ